MADKTPLNYQVSHCRDVSCSLVVSLQDQRYKKTGGMGPKTLVNFSLKHCDQTILHANNFSTGVRSVASLWK